jgi:hypothetical protein
LKNEAEVGELIHCSVSTLGCLLNFPFIEAGGRSSLPP